MGSSSESGELNTTTPFAFTTWMMSTPVVGASNRGAMLPMPPSSIWRAISYDREPVDSYIVRSWWRCNMYSIRAPPVISASATMMVATTVERIRTP